MQKNNNLYFLKKRFFFSSIPSENLDNFLCFCPGNKISLKTIRVFCKERNMHLTHKELSQTVKSFGGVYRRMLIDGRRQSVIYNINFLFKDETVSLENQENLVERRELGIYSNIINKKIFFSSSIPGENLDNFLCFSSDSKISLKTIRTYCKKKNLHLTHKELSQLVKSFGGVYRRMFIDGRMQRVISNINFTFKDETFSLENQENLIESRELEIDSNSANSIKKNKEVAKTRNYVDLDGVSVLYEVSVPWAAHLIRLC